MARPLSWNPKRQDDIVAMVSSGAYVETAARSCGITGNTLYTWMRRGRREIASREAGQDPNTDLDWAVGFVAAVEEARAKAEIRMVANIQRAAMDGTWQAGAWWLERTYPERYGRKVAAEVSGPGGAPIEVQAVPTEVLEQKLKAVLSSMGITSDDEEDDPDA